MTKKPAKREQYAQLREIFERHVPFNLVLGIEVVSIDPANPRLRFAMRPELVGNPVRGVLHGGVISAVLDAMAGVSIGLALIEKHGAEGAMAFPNMGTVDLRVDYLRPGRGKHFIASGRVVRLGSRIAVAHTELANDEGELIASGGATYVVG